MELYPSTKEAYQLMHDGMIAFSEIQQNGIKINVPYCQEQYRRLGKELKDIKKELYSFKEIKKWEEIYGGKMNFDSGDQLGHILFDVMGYEPKYTEKEKYATDRASLELLGLDFVNTFIQYRKLEKLRNTNLKNILKETQYGYLHPFMNLHTTKTFRSCIAKGTKILVVRSFKDYPDGIPIEKVRKGDFVYCYDNNLSPKIKRVLWAGKTGNRKVIRLHWRTRNRTGYLDVTPEHLIRKTDGSYVQAYYLTVPNYDVLFYVEGSNRVITKIEYINKKVNVYDIEVEDCHNFIANEICVHNSSNNINAQNQPIRDPVDGELIRKAFIPRKGCYLVASDYGGIEIKGSSWNNKDPVMLEYLRNPETADMHADFTKMIFKLDSFDKNIEGEKTLRKGTKNGFTFPQFYGDYYGNNAISLWSWAGLKSRKIKPNDGVRIKGDIPLGQHLIDHGIKNYHQFEKNIQLIEKEMWEKKFTEYNRWRKRIWKEYLKKGYIQLLTGFTCQGVMKWKHIINYPIQGCCSHCLLWSCIHIHEILKKEKMRSKIIFQVHDEIIGDVPKEEYFEYIDIVEQVMCHDIKDHWDFIITPLDIEIESSKLDGNWFEMEKILEYSN